VSAADLPALLQSFFTDRLLKQRRASPHTVTAYRNTFRLLLRFAAARLGRAPSRLELTDLDAAFLGEFLDHLCRHRRGWAPFPPESPGPGAPQRERDGVGRKLAGATARGEASPPGE
jgi:hypothetical protein